MPGTVYVRNERTSRIRGEPVPQQLYRFNVEAEPRDVMGLWYEASDTSQFYGDRSATISFVIPDAAPPATPVDGGTGDAGPTRRP